MISSQVFKSSFEYVEYLLKNRKYILCSIAHLKLDLEAAGEDTDQEAIEGMVFRGWDFDSPPSGPEMISNKTHNAAMLYRKEIRCTSDDVYQLHRVIERNELEIQKLDLAVEQLDGQLKQVIVGLYYEQLKWKDLKRRYYISDETINNQRVRGIEAVAGMFEGSKLIWED